MKNTLLAAGMAFGITVLTGPMIIGLLYRLRFGQQVRDDGPASHKEKQGTPTMGGILILIGLLFGTLFVQRFSGPTPYLLLAAFGFGVIGFLDDFIKIAAKRSLGLTARQKLLAQALLGIVIGVYAWAELGSTILIPFTGSEIELSAWVYITLAVVTFLASTNALNITDGLDGLAAGSTAIAAACFAVVASFLGYGDVAVYAGALGGACLGFAWFNSHPAQVFMGDTGSLALGGALGAIAILTRTPLWLPIIGGLFVIEAMSVIIQVTYFRFTGGKRIFRMSPIHHHFELKGWAEPKVVTRFWLVGLVCGLIGLIALPAF